MFDLSGYNILRRRAIRGMSAGLLLCALAVAGAVSAADSPSIRHTLFMRGQILEAQGSSLLICIGRADGASVGQELEVVHHDRVNIGPKGMGRYDRKVVGKVRIDAIVDEHYAEASVIEGKASTNDTVELARASVANESNSR